MAGRSSGSGAAGGPTFGQRLRVLREASGLSQEELAERAGVSADAVGALERGTRAHPYPATVRALADALALRPDERAALLAAVPRRSTAGVRRRADAVSREAPLPLAATPLLGREDDIAAVSALFGGSSVRLVTLTGTGGIGKTRLATAVAERFSTVMRDGLGFVELAPVLDESLVVSEIGRALNVDAGRSGGDDEILRVLAPLEVLLVLDNVEHLPGTGGIVAELLARCPEMRLLVTSRAPLRLRGETEYLVRPLGLPEPGATEPSVVAASPAASLLVERGRAVRREFAVRPVDVPAVVGICHRLAGLPLALELAAVGLRVLDPATLLARLDDVLEHAGPVDLPARQQSMRATLDWSYGLLSPEDQAVFRRASVFVGGFSMDAAEAVLSGGDVLGPIERLAAQSLFTVATAPDGRLRYGMLEPVAHYARSLLRGDEATAARLSHAEYFLEQAEPAEQALHRSELLESLGWYDTEESNLASALEWAMQGGRGEVAGRFVWALFMFWWVRGRREPGREVIARVLALDLSDSVRARVLHAAAALSEPGTVPAGDVEDLYLRSVELAERCGDRGVAAPSAIGAGLIALERGDPVTAEHRLRRGLSAAQTPGERGQWSAGLAHIWLAAARRFQGDAAGAVVHSRQALAITGRSGDLLSHCIGLYNLAQAEICLGQHRDARDHLVEATTLCQQTRDAGNLSYVLDALARLESTQGGRERVVTLLGAAEALRESVGSTVYRWYAPDIDQRVHVAEEARRRLGDAAYERAFDAGLSLTLDGAVELARRQVPPGHMTA